MFMLLFVLFSFKQLFFFFFSHCPTSSHFFPASGTKRTTLSPGTSLIQPINTRWQLPSHAARLAFLLAPEHARQKKLIQTRMASFLSKIPPNHYQLENSPKGGVKQISAGRKPSTKQRITKCFSKTSQKLFFFFCLQRNKVPKRSWWRHEHVNATCWIKRAEKKTYLDF